MNLNISKLVNFYISRDKKSPKKAIPLSIINFQFLKFFLEINWLNQTIFLGIKIAHIGMAKN
jgi:hypothetical protein